MKIGIYLTNEQEMFQQMRREEEILGAKFSVVDIFTKIFK